MYRSFGCLQPVRNLEHKDGQRANYLSNCVFNDYDAIIDAARGA